MRKWSEISEFLRKDLEPSEIRPADPGKGIYGSWLRWSDVAAKANALFGEEGWSVLSAEISHIAVGSSLIFYCTGTCRFWGALDNGTAWARDISDVGVGLAQEITDKKTGEIKAPRAQNVDTGLKASRSDMVKRCLKDLGKQLGLGLYNEDVDAIMERTGDHFLQMAQSQADEKMDAHELFALAGEYIVKGRKLYELWQSPKNQQIVRDLAKRTDELGMSCARFVYAAEKVAALAQFAIGEREDETQVESQPFGDAIQQMSGDTKPTEQSEEQPEEKPAIPAEDTSPKMVTVFGKQFPADEQIGQPNWKWVYPALSKYFENANEQLNSMRKHLSVPFYSTTFGKLAEYIAYKEQQVADAKAEEGIPDAEAKQDALATAQPPQNPLKWWQAQAPDKALSHWLGLYSNTTVNLQQLLLESDMASTAKWTERTHEHLDKMLTLLKEGKMKLDSKAGGIAWQVAVKSVKDTQKK